MDKKVFQLHFSNSILQELKDDVFAKKKLKVFLKRDDLLHEVVSGNKWRKLALNIENAKHQGKHTLLTFGGAYSNHIAATAYAAKAFGLKSIGFIRGEENDFSNYTLQAAKQQGMELIALSREEYAQRNNVDYLYNVRDTFLNAYVIPEGGANYYGIMGCADICNEIDMDYHYIACACGSGTTAAGLLLGKKENAKVIGFSALKGVNNFKNEIVGKLTQALMDNSYAESLADDLIINSDFHFGGFAKMTKELNDFSVSFFEKHAIELDFIYTAKMMFGLYNLIQSDYFPENTTIIAIHTGGLQGNRGMLERFNKKKQQY
jgi:1-aminocyclopropane-1-carboxylate deaminase